MRRTKTIIITLLFFLGLLGLVGCNSPSSDYADDIENTKNADKDDTDSVLVYESSMELKFAKNFKVDYYQGGYTILTTIPDSKRYLIVPENKEIPGDLDDDITVLKRPIKDIYLVASAVMDMFSELDGLSAITFSGQKEENWYIEKAKEAMAQGDILYAGKYSKPDYELLVSKECSLAIENTMITHSPEVLEKLKDFNIPAMIEYSSHESHPLGRVEWVKFFGALIGKEDKAFEIFDEQLNILNNLNSDSKTDKTVAFFYVTSNGLISVRQSNDYVPKMIELAGGKYIFENLGDPDSKRSTLNMQVEEFYNSAKDADYIIYNSSIDGGVSNIDELISKCELLKDFKAVKNGNVWCTTNDMYQQSLSNGYMIEDIHLMLTDQNRDAMHYLFRLND